MPALIPCWAATPPTAPTAPVAAPVTALLVTALASIAISAAPPVTIPAAIPMKIEPISQDFDRCPEGSICACGGCAPPCSAGECGNGGQCIDGYCVTDQCPEGYVCRDGRNCTPGERDNQPDAGGPTPLMDAGVPGIGTGIGGSLEVDDCKCDFGSRTPSTWTFLLMLLMPLLRTRRNTRFRP